MPFENRPQNDKAFAIASDPLATEKQWMAACTLMNNGGSPGEVSKPMPGAVGLPWSLAVSGVSGLGALMLYGFFLTGLYDAATLLTGSYGMFTGALGFALMSAGFAAFSSVFAYQQHLWQGGRMWPMLHWTIIGLGAFLPLAVLFFLSSGSVWDLITTGLWAIGFIGISIISTVFTKSAIKSLDATIGSKRVMPFTRSLLLSFGLIMVVCLNFPVVAVMVGAARWLWLPAVIVGSGFWIASANGARNAQTGMALALSLWNPLTMANLALLPALAINILGSFILPVGSISAIDLAIGISAIACLGIGPVVGARMASASMQKKAEESLHSFPTFRSLVDDRPPGPLSSPDKNLLSADGTMNGLSEEAV